MTPILDNSWGGGEFVSQQSGSSFAHSPLPARCYQWKWQIKFIFSSPQFLDLPPSDTHNVSGRWWWALFTASFRWVSAVPMRGGPPLGGVGRNCCPIKFCLVCGSESFMWFKAPPPLRYHRQINYSRCIVYSPFEIFLIQAIILNCRRYRKWRISWTWSNQQLCREWISQMNQWGSGWIRMGLHQRQAGLPKNVEY